MAANTSKQLSANDLKFNPPRFSEAVLHDFLHSQFGITGDLKPLAGERDQNIQVTTGDGEKYVLKIAGPDEPYETIDFQIKVLLHLEQKDPGLIVPRQIKNKLGGQASLIKDQKGRAHWVRLVSFVEGVAMDSYDHLSFDAIKAIGRIAGRLSAALKEFEHPAADNFMPWDSLNGLIFSEELRGKYLPGDFKELAETHLQRLKADGIPKLLALPHQVIHHDAHAGNVICEADNPSAVTGVIDFGDLTYRPVILDIAISLTSVLTHNTDILGATAVLLEGYQEYTAVADEQLELLYDAVVANYIIAVQLLSYRSVHHTDDPEKIRQEDLAGTIEAARIFLEFDRTMFTAHIMNAN